MEMTILQAVLCGVVYWLAVGNLPFVGLYKDHWYVEQSQV